MAYRILADIIVAIHFLWIVFMILGFVFTICAVLAVYAFHTRRALWRNFFDRWFFRTLHLAGIAYVAALTLLDKYCPLTILENAFRRRYDPGSAYPGSFIVYHIERLVYPNVDARLIFVPTIFIAAFTLIVFVLRPPAKIKAIFGRGRNENRSRPGRDDNGVS